MLHVTGLARDGVTRRTLLRAGVAGLPLIGRAQVRASTRKDTSVTFLFLGGGLSQLDS